MPDDGFRPHGIYIDNSTQRVFAISHSDKLEEESIYVFSIVDEGARVPALQFDFNLVSESFLWYPEENIWFVATQFLIWNKPDIFTLGFIESSSALLFASFCMSFIPEKPVYLGTY
jgi:hypothetical protein